MGMKTALIVPTLNAGDSWCFWLKAESEQSYICDDRLIIDSSSNDETLNLAKEQGFTTHQISRDQFDHGGTRQLAVEMVSDAEIIIFATQDATFASPDSIARIIECFSDKSIGAVYGRQLPDFGASPIAAHARLFNYPEKNVIKSKQDIPTLGLKTAFCSNSFSAYRRKSLVDVKGFPSKLIFGEDMYVAAKMIQRGWNIGYCADAQVRHSHNYSMIEDFQRSFDIGVFHNVENWLLQDFGKAEGEGKKFVLSELKYLLINAPWLIPSSFCRNALKYLGYKLGKNWEKIPYGIRQKLVMNKRFWRRNQYDGK